MKALEKRNCKVKYQWDLKKEDHDWLKCNTDPRKIASIFSLQEQMIETKAWKKMRGLVDQDKCQHLLAGQHLLTGCKKIAGSEYVRRHDNALKVLAVQWVIDNGGIVTRRNKVVHRKMGERESD